MNRRRDVFACPENFAGSPSKPDKIGSGFRGVIREGERWFLKTETMTAKFPEHIRPEAKFRLQKVYNSLNTFTLKWKFKKGRKLSLPGIA